MITSQSIFRRAARVSLICGAMFVAASSVEAQAVAASQPWRPWVGCWESVVQVAPTDVALSARAPLVCVLPSARASSVDVVTIDSGKVASRYTVDASGQQRTVAREGCAGWEKAQWSRDSLRVFLRSELTCSGSVKRLSSGIMSISPGGEWVDVQTVIAGGNEVVRTVRYRDAGIPSTLPSDIASSVTSSQRLDARTASLAAGAGLTAAAVAEAAQAVDTSAVQAWLIERHQKFQVDARTLIDLANAGVPGSVTDVMVALSYPEQFRFDRGSATTDRSLTRSDSARIASEFAFGRGIGCDSFSAYSPFGWGDPCYSYRYGYGLSRYGYGYGYGSGYGGYGYGGYGYNPYYGYYTRPVIIVREPEAPRGRAVNGQGYTRGTSSSSGSTAPRASRSGGYSSGKSDGSSSSGASKSSGGSSSSGASTSSGGSSSSGASSTSSSGRTAHTRPPKSS